MSATLTAKDWDASHISSHSCLWDHWAVAIAARARHVLRTMSIERGPAGKRRQRAGNDQLLDEISAFCRASGMAESTFGRRAVNDGKFVARLRFGGRVTT